MGSILFNERDLTDISGGWGVLRPQTHCTTLAQPVYQELQSRPKELNSSESDHWKKIRGNCKIGSSKKKHPPTGHVMTSYKSS